MTSPAAPHHLVLGVIGHVDHGKTSLVRALTGMETDRLAEEQLRGISIALGFAHLPLGDGTMDVVDTPGHERFVRTMVSGATGLGAVLLVVAANEGVMPQTREHVDIVGLLGVRHALIAVTKADLVEPGRCLAVGAQAASLVAKAGLHVAAPPVPVSAVTGAGIGTLRAALATVMADALPAEHAGFAYLPIDRAFSIAGHGTVVTGTLRRGALAAEDELEVVPGGVRLRVRALQVHGARVAAAQPGQRVAVNLRGVEPADVPRGMALATPGVLTPSSWLGATARAVEGAPALRNGARLQLLIGTAELECRLRLLDRNVLEAGQSASVQLRTAVPVAVPARERFILRLPSPALTVAGGQVLDPDTTRQRRRAPSVLARLAALGAASPEAVLAWEVDAAGPQGVPVERVARVAGLGTARAIEALQAARLAPVLVARGRVVVAAAAFAALLDRLPGTLASRPEGFGREALRAVFPSVSPAVLEEAVLRLVGAGTLRQVGGLIRVADVVRERDSARQEEAAAANLADELRRAGLTPPDLQQLAPDPARRRLLRRLVREGVVVSAVDRVQKRELVFHRDAVEAAQRVLAPRLAGAGMLVSEAGAALGISRKFSVPLLEHLDSIRYTRRVADRRVLAKPE